MGLDAETVSKKDIDALFDTFDPDRSGSVDYHELNKALRRRVELDPSLRAGAAGAIELTSKNKSNRKPATGGGWGRARTKMRAASALKGAKGKRGKGSVVRIELDLESDVSIQDQLKARVPAPSPQLTATLTHSTGHCLHHPVATTVPQDGLAKNSARVIDLFREWDDDGNGEVSKKEFGKAMRKLGGMICGSNPRGTERAPEIPLAPHARSGRTRRDSHGAA